MTEHDEATQNQGAGEPSAPRWRLWVIIGVIGAAMVAAMLVIWGMAAGDDTVQRSDDEAADAVIPNVAETHGEDARMSMTDVPTEEFAEVHQPYRVPDEVETDAAGYTMKELGEPGQLTAGSEGSGAEDEAVLHSLMIEDIEITDQCMLRSFDHITTPEGEHFIMVDVTASVEEDIDPYIESDVEDYYLPLVHDAFALLDEHGERIEGYTETAYGCLDLDERLDAFIDAGEETSGTIVFDVEELPERIAYDPDYVGGWSWDMPAQ